MNLLFINRYFYPDTAPTSQMLADLAFGLAAQGRTVTVITSRQRYADPRARLPARETVAGVAIIRVWSSRFGRARILGRSWDYLTFYVAATLALLHTVRPGDLVIPKTDPPLFGILAGWVCHWRGARCLHWLQDIFPEIAEALGLKLGFWGRWLARQRDLAIVRSCGAVVIGADMQARLRARGILPEKLHLIPNWADGALLQPAPASGERATWGWEGRLVVGYAGNLGRAHEVATLSAAIAALAHDDRVAFLVSGGGAGWQRLQALQRQHDWTHLRFLPYQPQDKLAVLLNLSDVHLVSLRAGLEGWLVPSKFYASLAVGKPVIYVGAAAGEVAQQVQAHACGWVIAPGASAELVALLRTLAAEPARYQAAGAQGRATFMECWDKPRALTRWNLLLDRIEGDHGTTISN